MKKKNVTFAIIILVIGVFAFGAAGSAFAQTSTPEVEGALPAPQVLRQRFEQRNEKRQEICAAFGDELPEGMQQICDGSFVGNQFGFGFGPGDGTCDADGDGIPDQLRLRDGSGEGFHHGMGMMGRGFGFGDRNRDADGDGISDQLRLRDGSGEGSHHGMGMMGRGFSAGNGEGTGFGQQLRDGTGLFECPYQGD